MAKTQHDIDRDAKAKAIATVARRLFVDEGYDAISMSRLALEANVAPNTLYWYFADKDALLLAVLDAVLADALQDWARRKQSSFEARLLWLLDQLESVQKLISTVHARSNVSRAVNAWHDAFHELFEAYVLEQLREAGFSDADGTPASRLIAYCVEGLLAHPTSRAERRAFVRFLIESLGARVAHRPKKERGRLHKTT
jgi:AcrR family transcriptional regulator